MELLKYAAEQGLLHADVVAYAALNDAHELTEENPAYTGPIATICVSAVIRSFWTTPRRAEPHG